MQRSFLTESTHLSDGEISDKTNVLSKAARLEQELATAGRTAPTQVSLIRLLTSSRADPDTKALACLGQLNTSGAAFPVDISMTEGNYTEVMATTISNTFK